MDYLALFVIAFGLILYLLTKNRLSIFVCGFGFGLLAGATWAAIIVNQALR